MSLQNASVNLTLNIAAKLDSAGDLGTGQTNIQPNTQYSTAGTADGQADTSYVGTFSVTAGTPVAIDVNAGTIRQADGTIATITDLTTLLIQSTGTAGTVAVGGGSNPVANIAGVVGPGGYVLWNNPTVGYPVVAGSADTITLTASAGTIVVKLVIIGRSA